MTERCTLSASPSSINGPVRGAAGSTRRIFLKTAVSAALVSCARRERVAVLTFDDAPRSHREFVAPLLAEHGFQATFFVTHRWMDDRENFMTWEQIGEIHEMGFEIGNHSWTHSNFGSPKSAALLEGELALVTNELEKVGVPRPTSFAWCGNGFGPEALATLRRLGYKRARRGMQPEIEYGAMEVGPIYEPSRHDPLLIPTTGDAYPDWSLEHFGRVLDRADDGTIVLQFHGVPDTAHPWVSTPPERFRKCLKELAARGFRCIAVRDLDTFAAAPPPNDPLVSRRYPEPEDGVFELPAEQAATQRDLDSWTPVFLRYGYSADEAARVAMFSADQLATYEQALASREQPAPSADVEVLPYPGGRHPRIGFLEGAIDPLRGTKAGVFLPWDPTSYVVVDLPELITSHLGHLFLAHTHVPTIWNDRNVWLDNVDWTRRPDGALELEWALPNGVVFGSRIAPASAGGVDMELWLRNGLDETLTGLRTQICVMLKGAPEFNTQQTSNKVFEQPVAAVKSAGGDRWILTAWQRAGRVWGNKDCPCIHSDPVLPDCPPGQTVSVRGRLWFHEGPSIDEAIVAARRDFA